MLTTFLIITVFALILGNVFLAVTRTSEEKTEEPYQTVEYGDDEPEYPIQSPPGRNFNDNYHKFDANQLADSQTMMSTSSAEALNQKVMMAHQRLNELENAIVKIGKATLEKDETKNGKIKEKLDSLINQKNDAKIEIEALKDRVVRLENLNELPHESSEEETEDLKQKIHDLAFNKESA